MNLIDTHCHIYSGEFNADRPVMVARAENEGIIKMLMPAIDASTHEEMFRIEDALQGKCLSMMGLHPCSVKEGYEKELKIAEQNFSQRPFVAVGETGLDFYWDLSFTKQQYDAFQQQIEWALQHDIPIVIHSRNSMDECSYITYVANKLAQVKKMAVEEIAETTTDNAKKLFKL